MADTPSPAKKIKRVWPKEGPKILVADDERPLSKALELKLSRNGFQVEVANNGEEALEKIAATKFDLAILDLIMPRVDGFGVLEKLKAEGNKLPIIVISNLSQNDDITKAKSLGALEFFTKSNMPLTDIVNYIAQTLDYEPKPVEPAGDIAA